MGQALCLDLREDDDLVDFRLLPTEIVLRILEYLSPGDLSKIARLNSQWHRVANIDLIWKRLCAQRVAGLNVDVAARTQLKWKQVYIMAQQFIFYFNISGNSGLSLFIEMHLVKDDAESVARFLNGTRKLNKFQIGKILTDPQQRETMHAFVHLQAVRNVFLGEALRDLLCKFELPKALPASRFQIVEKFAEHYWQNNQHHLTFSQETTVLLVFSLMMLSADLSSPHIKNKMTKREFIRNLRRNVDHGEAAGFSTDYLGLLYDFVFLQGLSRPTADAARRANSSQPSQQRVCHTVVSQMSQNRFRPWETAPRLMTLR